MNNNPISELPMIGALQMGDFLPLLPVGVLALTVLIVMLIIAFKRQHGLAALMSAIGLNIALIVTLLQFFDIWHTPHYVGALFVVDKFALFNAMAILIAALACVTLSFGYFAKFKDNKEELYLLLLTATMGALLMTSAQSLASFFMALELLSVPTYGMLAYTFLKPKSLESGIKYLILSATASATLLMGMAFIFAATGALEFSAIMQALWGHHINFLSLVGVVMIVAAVAFKLSLAPFHAWVGDVYEGAPAPMTAFLASASKVAMVALALRFFITTATPALPSVATICVLFIALSVIFGNLLALRQTNLKRMIAYSSIAHMGYALMPLVAIGELADTTISAYMLVYALTSVGALGVIVLLAGSVAVEQGASHLNVYQGLFWRRPILAFIMTIMLLSLAGIPFTAGFMTKMQVMLAVVQGGKFVLAALLILGSAVGLYYYLRTILTMYKRPLQKVHFHVSDKWQLRTNGLMVVLVALLLFLWGVLPNSLVYLSSLSVVLR